jgi:hypothetical protein
MEPAALPNWRSFTEIERKRNASSEPPVAGPAAAHRQLAFVYRNRAEKERQFGVGSGGQELPEAIDAALGEAGPDSGGPVVVDFD